MTRTEMVTEFSLQGATLETLLRALNAHLKTSGIEPEEYGFTVSPSITLKFGQHQKQGHAIPAQFRHLIAYAVEGSNEGYYIHVGAIVGTDFRQVGATATDEYMDFGFCKTYSAESAYIIAKETQRFLTAASWN